MTPSPYQEAIFHEIEFGSGSLAIIAVAGSGKTTTIVEAARRLDPTKLAVFLAFNKNIADELKDRLPYFVQAHTFHSFSFNAIKQSFAITPKVEANKTKKVLETLVDKSELFDHLKPVVDLVSYAKNHGLGMVDDAPTWEDLVWHYDVMLESDATLELAKQTFAKSNEDFAHVDFDDMLYFALRPSVRFTPCDFVFVDEVQDLNAVQHLLLKKMLKPTGRLIAVGDPNQAIYGFRGAEADGFARLIEEFNCRTLPLSVSYRCSRAVVHEAQRILKENYAVV